MNRKLWLTPIGIAFVLVLAAGFSAWAQDAETETLDDLRQAQEEQQDTDQFEFDLPLADETGRVTFSDLADSEKPFILFWWLTDCPLCHLQLPYIQQLQDQIDEGELDLLVVTLCIDFETQECLEYLRKNELSLAVLHDPRARSTDSAYQIKELGCPLTYVFDEGGVLVDYIKGFRSNIGKSVIELLDLEQVDQRETRRPE